MDQLTRVHVAGTASTSTACDSALENRLKLEGVPTQAEPLLPEL